MLKIHYELTLDDLVQYSLYHFFKESPSSRRGYLFRWLFPPCVAVATAAAVFWLLTARKPLFGMAAVASSPLLVFAVVHLLVYPSYFRRHYIAVVKRLYSEGRNRSLLGPHEVVLSAHSMQSKSELVETTYKWPAVEKIVATPDYAFFYASALSAIVIPRRAFASDEEFKHFVETARKYQEARDGASVLLERQWESS